MSQQTAFDLVATKLLKQGQPAVSKEDDTCVYLNPKGHRCAAGHLMTTRELAALRKSGKLGSGFRCLPEELCQRILDRHRIEVEFVMELQSAHDHNAAPLRADARIWCRGWIERMRLIASRHKLSVAVLGRRGLSRPAGHG